MTVEIEKMRDVSALLAWTEYATDLSVNRWFRVQKTAVSF